MYETQEELETDLATFDEEGREALTKLVAAQNFWREGLKRNIDIPYNAARSVPGWREYVNLAQYLEWDAETSTSPLDVDATQKQFARVIRWAKENGWPIEKKYDDDYFKIIVENTPIGTVEFSSTRQVVCKRVQTGTKHIEAHEEPVYEYECDKVAFLKVEV